MSLIGLKVNRILSSFTVVLILSWSSIMFVSPIMSNVYKRKYKIDITFIANQVVFKDILVFKVNFLCKIIVSQFKV